MARSEPDVLEGSKLQQVGNVFLLAHHVLIICGAAAWIVTPSASIGAAFGPPWAGGLSLTLGFFAFVAFIARLCKAWQLEAIGVGVTASILILWGSAVIYASAFTGWGGVQTGLILIAGGFYRSGWISTTFAWLHRQEFEASHLTKAVTAELNRRAEGL